MTKRCLAGLIGVVVLLSPPLEGQDLADYDYENLSYRGVGVHGLYVAPSSVDATTGIGVRADLGYLGPGLRIVPSLGYWASQMKASEVAELERSVERLIQDQAPGAPSSVDLGAIDRWDLVLGLDAHVVFRTRYNFLTYAGAGAAAHFLNGGGDAIDDTFVEDLLDSVTAGFNLHGGIEVPATSWLRIYGEARFEILDDIYYPDLRLGVQFMTGEAAPGEDGS
jgi:hypothetical protein